MDKLTYHAQKTEQVLQTLQTSSLTGLTHSQATNLIKKHGQNKLAHAKKEAQLTKFVRQFKNILVLVLIFAVVFSFVVGQITDAIIVLAIVLINATMGYIQETRAERAIEALKALSTDYTKVLRDSEVMQIQVSELVPGDIIFLESGDKVPADARLLETTNFEVTEAILTGEAHPIKKHTNTLRDTKVPIGDRLNMLYKDTTVVYGRAKAVVTATGTTTEIGKISTLLQKQKDVTTPLSKELDIVGKRLSGFAVIIIVGVALLGFATQTLNLKETIEIAISLAVAAIPEGLPAIITVVLAMGVSKLTKHKAIIRRLSTVETLGSTNYILTDKTGTLTQNKMTVTNIATLTDSYDITTDKEQTTYLNQDKNVVTVEENKELNWLLTSLVLCNNAVISKANSHAEFIGDSTETALLELAYYTRFTLSQEYKRLYEIPFSSKAKRMTVVVQDPKNEDQAIVISKGAPEVITHTVSDNGAQIYKLNDAFAKQGLRSLAFSYKRISLDTLDKIDKNTKMAETQLNTEHTFIGIVAQKDPLRPKVKNALEIAKRAGITTIMVTGDHKLTATNIARELGLITSMNQVMDGQTLKNKKGKELTEILKKVRVFARVSPEQKLNLANALKMQDYVVAVTGDGVNDAPAIKTADIGISMGISGTDVAKEVSDMILQDDNYATIVDAIKQGRIIYDNLVKFITYLISCNMSEIIVFFAALAVGIPLPIQPIQLLWVNLVTDGAPALALGLEAGEKDIMLRHPRSVRRSLLTKRRWIRMTFQSILISAGTFAIFLTNLETSIIIAQTAALTALTFSQLFHALNNQSEIHSIFSRYIVQNKKLLLTIGTSAVIQLLVVYSPIGNALLKTVPINRDLFVLAVVIAFIPVLGTEIYKWFGRQTRQTLA